MNFLLLTTNQGEKSGFLGILRIFKIPREQNPPFPHWFCKCQLRIKIFINRMSIIYPEFIQKSKLYLINCHLSQNFIFDI